MVTVGRPTFSCGWPPARPRERGLPLTPYPLDCRRFPVGRAAAQDRNRQLVVAATVTVVVRDECDRIRGALIDRPKPKGVPLRVVEVGRPPLVRRGRGVVRCVGEPMPR